MSTQSQLLIKLAVMLALIGGAAVVAATVSSGAGQVAVAIAFVLGIGFALVWHPSRLGHKQRLDDDEAQRAEEAGRRAVLGPLR